MSRPCFLFSSSAAMSQRFSFIFSLFILIFVLSEVDSIIASYLHDVQATTDKLSVTRKNEQPSTTRCFSEAMSEENSRTRREIQSFDDDFSLHQVRRQILEDNTHQYFINIIVFADTSMSDFYGNELERYIKLTMAKVARLFKHFTIGNSISFGSVKIEKTNKDFLNKNNYEFNKPLMDNFCQWQNIQRNNPRMQNLNNSHVALLLTRNPLYPVGHQNQVAVGIARLSSICDPNLSCTGVQDGHYSTASVIAHEIGHLLGMQHDDDNLKNTCLKNDNNRSSYLMNARETNKQHLMWSNCSREYVTQFLNSGGGDCLLAKPREKFDEKRYEHLGQQYSLTKMCKFAFGPEYYALKLNDTEKCETFECSKNPELEYTYGTRSLMVPDGTTCGYKKICYEGECISSYKLTPINGRWSDYGDFSKCSRTCGVGIKMKHRYCNNPTPMYGGKYCSGKKIYYEICASNKCPDEEPQDFRERQCAEINNNNNLNNLGIENINVNWKFKLAWEVPSKPCVLYCKNDKNGDYVRQNQVIIDGTPCKDDNSHICVQGVCKKYGCDYKLDSTAELDICGVCNGNNSTCHKITKRFRDTLSKAKTRYNYIYTIPAGSHHIDIKQYTKNPSSPRENYIALKLAKNGSYILNGNLAIRQYSNIYESSGINISNSVINNAIMQVTINKSIVDDLIVEVLFIHKFVITETLIEYYIPNESKNDYHYIWTTGEWSRCNATCKGIKTRDVHCQRTENNLIVANSFCQTEQPISFMECNSNSDLRLDIGSETACSAKCAQKKIYSLYYYVLWLYLLYFL